MSHTLAELAPHELDADGPSPTGLVRRCRALMTRPLAEFTIGDLRVMLGQQIGVRHLLPLAAQVLLQDPLAEGDFYPGDLLVTVARLPPEAWTLEQRQLLGARLQTITTDDALVAGAIAQLTARP